MFGHKGLEFRLGVGAQGSTRLHMAVCRNTCPNNGHNASSLFG